LPLSDITKLYALTGKSRQFWDVPKLKVVQAADQHFSWRILAAPLKCNIHHQHIFNVAGKSNHEI